MYSGFGISVGAASCHLLTQIIVNKYRPPEARSYRYFTSFYFVMQIFQAFQWFNGDVTIGCTMNNKFFTVIAYALIWVQPLLYVIIGKNAKSRSLLIRLEHSEKISKYLFIYSIILLLLGFLKTSTDLQTCTYVGEHGHLAWEFNPFLVSYSPTYLVYILLIFMTIIHYPYYLSLTVGLGWICSLIVALILVGSGPEKYAVWGQLSILVDIPIIIRALTH
jgi:hypothetical protein